MPDTANLPRMRLKLEHAVESEDELPSDLGPKDIGRTWWHGLVWHVWTGERWFKAIASRNGRS